MVNFKAARSGYNPRVSYLSDTDYNLLSCWYSFYIENSDNSMLNGTFNISS
jgi:hypothetical protein